MIRKFIPLLITAALLLVFQTKVEAQCAMCKAVLESNMQSGEEAVGKGINDGIIYIMFVPYILIAVGIYLLYRHHKKTADLKLD